MTVTHEPGDTVALTARLLFSDNGNVRREGTVVAVADDGKVTVEFPQAPYSPMRVTDDAEHFIPVRKAPQPVGYAVLLRTATGARLVVGLVYGSPEAAAEAAEVRRRSDFGADGTFTVCRLVPEAKEIAAA